MKVNTRGVFALTCGTAAAVVIAGAASLTHLPTRRRDGAIC